MLGQQACLLAACSFVGGNEMIKWRSEKEVEGGLEKKQSQRQRQKGHKVLADQREREYQTAKERPNAKHRDSDSTMRLQSQTKLGTGTKRTEQRNSGERHNHSIRSAAPGGGSTVKVTEAS